MKDDFSETMMNTIIMGRLIIKIQLNFDVK